MRVDPKIATPTLTTTLSADWLAGGGQQPLRNPMKDLRTENDHLRREIARLRITEDERGAIERAKALAQLDKSDADTLYELLERVK